jgi:general secretion pathway protein G
VANNLSKLDAEPLPQTNVNEAAGGSWIGSSISLGGVELPTSVVLSGLVVVAYLCFVLRRRSFSVLHALILVALMATTTAVAVPLVQRADEQAQDRNFKETLEAIRSQINLYKAEHDGRVPLWFEGSLPQLTDATDVLGAPGPQGKEYPFGPYFRHGLPANPCSGIATVTLTDTFPPEKPSGTGGWLYHQQTGSLAADTEGRLRE